MLHRPLRHAAALLVAVALLTACDEETPTASLDRATFIDTYVELRAAALQRGLPTVDDALRDSVLASRGVSEEALVEFAEVHGAELDYMQGVWAEVSERLDSLRFDPVSSGKDPSGG